MRIHPIASRPAGARLARLSRRVLLHTSLLAVAQASMVVAASREARADETTAPASVQAQLLTRLLPFDRGIAAKVTNGTVTVTLVSAANDADSTSAVLHMEKELSDIGHVGGWALATKRLVFATAAGLVRTLTEAGAQVAYLAPGLSAQVAAIGQALAGTGILTFAAVEDDVARGAVIGVTLDGGRPRMSINLAQMRAQRIDYPASVLKLARIY